MPRLYSICVLASLSILVAGCGDSMDFGGNGGSNRARLEYDCNLNGIPGDLTLEIEAIGDSGITWGPGPNPDITGVIPTGDFIYYTTGTLALPDRTYGINGENYFAELWSNVPGDRITVEWQFQSNGLTMIWDWFNSARPVPCALVGSSFF